MYLSELIKKTKTELNAMKKDDIVDVLSQYGFQYNGAVQAKEEAEKSLKHGLAESNMCKQLIIAYLGKDVKRCEYNNTIENLHKMELSTLLGELMGNVDKVRNQEYVNYTSTTTGQ